ncbi:MAG: Hsp20/alpha crystallin family protein [Pseudomonadota bacterium]
MSSKKEGGFEKITQEIDLRLDGLFGELGSAITEALGRLDEGASEVRRFQDIQTPRGPVRAEAGIRVRMGGAAFSADSAEEVDPKPKGHSTKPTPAPEAPKAIKIAATELREPDFWSLSADLPGVAEDDLRLDFADGALKIRASTRQRVYEGTFALPRGVSEETVEVSLVNGILDLTADLSAATGSSV